MAIIRSFNQPAVEPKLLQTVALPSNVPSGAFGTTAQAEGDAKALQVAGEQLGKASDTTERIALAMKKEATRLASLRKGSRP